MRYDRGNKGLDRRVVQFHRSAFITLSTHVNPNHRFSTISRTNNTQFFYLFRHFRRAKSMPSSFSRQKKYHFVFIVVGLVGDMERFEQSHLL